MDRMETLRQKLYEAIETGDKQVIQSLSNELDKEILKAIPKHGKKEYQTEQIEALE